MTVYLYSYKITITFIIIIIIVVNIKVIKMSAVKRLIAINHIQNKSFCLHNICVCSVYICYVYINTHTYSIYFENIYMSIFKFIYFIL